MSKFNPKIFKGSTITVKVAGVSGISKMYEWSPEKSIYEVPLYKKVYRARKTVILNGKQSRPSEYFNSLEEAKHWLQNLNMRSLQQHQNEFNKSTFQEILESWKRAN